jgi:hypothetical protein
MNFGVAGIEIQRRQVTTRNEVWPSGEFIIMYLYEFIIMVASWQEGKQWY